MKIRPYPAWGLLAAALAVSAWRLFERPGAEYALNGERVSRWASLARTTPEEVDRGLAHRYRGLAQALEGAREAGYFSDRSGADFWIAATIPGELDRLQRYYMAQGLLPPTVLRVDAIRPLVVVDCATPEQARLVLTRQGLTEIQDFGGGLILGRPRS
jgi:hypothetical protein